MAKWKKNARIGDEFKYFDQIEAIMKDKPIYKAIFLSTPEGTEDLFAKEIFDPECKQPNNKYKKIWFPVLGKSRRTMA